MSDKTNPGYFFEDFRLGQRLVHATPRTVTEGEVSLYVALTGSRFPLNSSDLFAGACGLEAAPLDDLLVFHLAFGKTVPDVSLNAVANLGYADCRFGVPVFPGDSLSTVSEVIGLKQASNGTTGVVYVRSHCVNQVGETVLAWIRWVLVNKRDAAAPAPEPVVPALPEAVPYGELVVPEGFEGAGYDCTLAGSLHLWEDYEPGERIDHVDAMTLEEAEHQLATRLYQNTAKVHFDQLAANANRFGRRIVYGGHVISIARALSFNGLANASRIAAINGGSHVAPTFAGHTLFAWSEVLDKAPLPGRDDLGVLRVRTVATKDRPCADFPDKGADGRPDPAVVLDLDYSVLMPRRA
ncbi:L-erythro-3-methylmalyl-CoA dehydratase [Tistlia consotensis]|uniref:L-erythro-3-methylmalyl-CoA dehydratase n=1 Tax=Tistlia consotensis USBA 355 TaxID=560819 RepID=A0A1Y6BNM8_9PROT|nr:MaoC family dehydratase [Tistlia consotensis]SMF10169.1 L-erythro-3-methylmalyl-CoA dehydratase [Tistlia consotensis USBA 355]SNR33934.1 L-erythro-3-methylmalyl-CoA dehydratase [Tistlia consotensis]